jgi:hypothetical protein
MQTLDDILIEDGKVALFSPPKRATRPWAFRQPTASRRRPRPATYPSGERSCAAVVDEHRQHPHNVTLPGARIKLVGGVSGRVEYEEFVEQVLLAPSKRIVVDVLVESHGELALEHHIPNRTSRLAAITVTERAPSTAATQFAQRRRAPELEAERAQAGPLAAAPDKILALDGLPTGTELSLLPLRSGSLTGLQNAALRVHSVSPAPPPVRKRRSWLAFVRRLPCQPQFNRPRGFSGTTTAPSAIGGAT